MVGPVFLEDLPHKIYGLHNDFVANSLKGDAIACSV
jgi:hypothetical protein